MLLKKTVLSLALATSLASVACTRNITYTTSTPLDGVLRTEATTTTTTGGGVINGGGGKGVLCKKNGKTTVEILDLYEAKKIYNHTPIDFGTDEKAGAKKLADLFAKHMWNPFTIDMEEQSQAIEDEYINTYLNDMRFIEAGQRLRLINDSYEPMLEEGCEYVQVAHYYDESILLVDREYWNQMDVTNKMGLLAHEFSYFYVRSAGVTNSVSVRKLVGKLLSKEGLRPIAQGVPASEENFVFCAADDNSDIDISFWAFDSVNKEGNKGLELVYMSSGVSAIPMFRTSSFEGYMTLEKMTDKNDSWDFSTAIDVDTYPTRDRINVKLKERVPGPFNNFKIEVTVRNDTTKKLIARGEVHCQQKVALKAVDAELVGSYLGKHDATPDFMTISADATIVLEQTRQVGRDGNAELPYETVCRYKETGKIVSQNNSSLMYEVSKIELIDVPENSSRCQLFIARSAKQIGVNYLMRVDLSHYTKQ